MDINTNIFRAYDIRGIAYEDLTEEVVYKLGKSLGSSALTRKENLLIVGRDGRNSSPDMYKWISSGIKSTGCNVLNIGVVPTPLLYFSTFKLGFPSGVMITGSHNPAQYNGFKIVKNKKTISGKDIQEIKEYKKILQTFKQIPIIEGASAIHFISGLGESVYTTAVNYMEKNKHILKKNKK